MKKTKIGLVIASVLITIIVTLLIAMTVSEGGGDSEWDTPWTWPSAEYTGSVYYGFKVSDVTAAGFNNIYCIENGERLDSGKVLKMPGYTGDTNHYIVSAVVSIPGDAEDNAWVCTYDQSEDGRFWYGDMRNKHAEIKITVKN